MRELVTKRNIILFAVLVAALALAVVNIYEVTAFANKLMGIISPLLVGLFVAFILELIATRMENVLKKMRLLQARPKLRRVTSVLLAVLILILVVMILMIIIIPQLVYAIWTMVEQFPALYDQGMQWINKLAERAPAINNFLHERVSKSGTDMLNKGLEAASGWAANALKTGSNFFGKIFSGIVAIIFAIYILLGRDNLVRQSKRLVKAFVPVSWHGRIKHIMKVAEESFSSFFIGQTIEACIVGVLCFVGMSLLKFPYVGMIASVMALTNFLPIIGAFIGGSVGFLMVLTESPSKALFFLIFVVVLQQFEGNIIYPRVVGGSVGLPGIWVFTTVVVGGGLFGIPGIFLGIPFTSIVYKLLRESVNRRLGDGDVPIASDGAPPDLVPLEERGDSTHQK